jgi:hypothetical protein
MRTRIGASPATHSSSHIVLREWDATRTAVLICDMWDAHHCVTAAQRTATMASRVNTVAGALRAAGALIIHAPAGCTTFYAGTPARARAMDAPAGPAYYRVQNAQS